VVRQMELVAEQKHSYKLPLHTRRAKEFRRSVANRVRSERAKCKRANRPSDERNSSALIFTALQRGQGELLAFKAACKASLGSGPREAASECTISGNDIMARFYGQILLKQGE